MAEIDYKHVGKCILRARVESGLSKNKFAKYIGTDNRGLIRIERGRGIVTNNKTAKATL